MNKKYRILTSGKDKGRIQALRDFDTVKKGDVGGFVESENNLSHEGNAWVSDDARIYGNAQVYGSARIYGNAQVYGSARIYGNAQVYGSARIYDNARIYGNARISDDAWIYGSARIYGNAQVYGSAGIYGNAQVYGSARIYGNAQVYGSARIYDNSQVYGSARIYGNAQVYGSARIYDNARIYDDAQVYGSARIYGNAWIYGNAQVYGSARIYGNARIKYGKLRVSLVDTTTIRENILSTFNLIPVKNKLIMYKRVNRFFNICWVSIYDGVTIYRKNKITEVKKINDDFFVSCDTGLHVSTPAYWLTGDVLIACEIDIKDIVSCQDGKLRVRKLKCLGEV